MTKSHVRKPLRQDKSVTLEAEGLPVNFYVLHLGDKLSIVVPENCRPVTLTVKEIDGIGLARPGLRLSREEATLLYGMLRDLSLPSMHYRVATTAIQKLKQMSEED